MPPEANPWDPKLYEGSAPYYARGRLPYPSEMAAALRDELVLDGTGRLIDLGCGPGSVALLLAPLFAEVVGVDADGGMIAEAGTEAALRGVENARWVEMPAEALPDDLGSFRVATLAQSFHWMDRKKVASTVRGMLEPAGSLVHINATTHQGVGGTYDLPLPSPPHAEIGELIHEYLGPTRRAGGTTLDKGTPSGEDAVMVAAGFSGPRRVTVAGHIHERSEEEVVASVFSLSWAAPHLFAERIGKFETELRRLLRRASPEGRFAERAREIELVIWTK
jgi:ubiquinone/menaquinone biosynthesis C-methylase UbiE